MSEEGPSRGWLGPGPASHSADRRDLGSLSQGRGGHEERGCWGVPLMAEKDLEGWRV